MSASRIRYYEARGLLPEPERVAGKRRYTADARVREVVVRLADVERPLEDVRLAPVSGLEGVQSRRVI